MQRSIGLSYILSQLRGISGARGRPRKPEMQPALASKRKSKPQLVYAKRGHALVQALDSGFVQLLACVSVRHFERAFRQSLGVLPHMYVLERRVSAPREARFVEVG
jgi:AraC-like DNA-binding protein